MPIPNDPILLLSYLNTQLRDKYPSLAALCDDLQLDCTALCEKIASVGYEYHPTQNQFK
ncbi:MAG: DUF4250 domain-containing protein [Faecalibacterium sp.]